MSQTEDRLKELGVKLLRRSKLPLTNCGWKRHGNLLFIGGSAGGEQASYASAYEAGLALLSRADDGAAGLKNIEATLRLTVLCRCAPGETTLNEKADGASDALTDTLGARGLHTRTVLGAIALEGGTGIVCSAIFQVR